jgi:hypothetical protein
MNPSLSLDEIAAAEQFEPREPRDPHGPKTVGGKS